jgi:D-3-phosphoglycerate dehydrogenase
MAAQRYDSITIDVQHGALEYSSALPMLQAMRASGVVPMARVPWMEPGIIMKVLDAGAYVIRTQPLSATTIADARQLKIVSRRGVGYDAVDVPALNNRRIPLCIVGDVNSLSVTEHVILLILACAKRLIRADRSVRACSWEWRNRLEATDIYGKRLLIVGYGRIGGHLARLATGFGMEIHAFDPLLAERGWPEGPVNPAPTLADGLAWADVVSVSVPKAARPILGVEEFSLMKPDAILVNTARGGIVDEAALSAALADGRVVAAGLDVFDDEPPAQDHPLLGLDQVVLTPHIAVLHSRRLSGWQSLPFRTCSISSRVASTPTSS